MLQMERAPSGQPGSEAATPAGAETAPPTAPVQALSRSSSGTEAVKSPSKDPVAGLEEPAADTAETPASKSDIDTSLDVTDPLPEGHTADCVEVIALELLNPRACDAVRKAATDCLMVRTSGRAGCLCMHLQCSHIALSQTDQGYSPRHL